MALSERADLALRLRLQALKLGGGVGCPQFHTRGALSQGGNLDLCVLKSRRPSRHGIVVGRLLFLQSPLRSIQSDVRHLDMGSVGLLLCVASVF